ncbi:helix-turn-helix domain-containing protein [Candidatus Omnitrophota bacterium]
MDDYIKKLRQIREERNISLDQCADELGIAAQILTMIELGEVIPTEPQKELIMQYILDQI